MRSVIDLLLDGSVGFVWDEALLGQRRAAEGTAELKGRVSHKPLRQAIEVKDVPACETTHAVVGGQFSETDRARRYGVPLHSPAAILA